MSILIIDVFEPVDVQGKDAERSPQPFGTVTFTFQGVKQSITTRYTGQAVAIQFLLESCVSGLNSVLQVEDSHSGPESQTQFVGVKRLRQKVVGP